MHLVLRGRWWVTLLLIILLIIGLVVLPKPVLAMYDQIRAGKVITQVIDSQAGFFACEIPFSISSDNLDQLLKAVNHLKQSIQYEPGYSQSYLSLGQAYCLLDQYDRAVEALKVYIKLRPNNPLGHLELGFAEYMLCSNEGYLQGNNSQSTISPMDIYLCRNKDRVQQIQSEWHRYGIDTSQFLTKARSYFANKQYSDAHIWYQRALKYDLLSTEELGISDQYKLAVSAVLNESELPRFLITTIPIVEINSPTTIMANQLHWFSEIPNWKVNYGDSIPIKTIDQHIAGILYWSGVVGVFISVPQDGTYQISIQVQNTLPAPVSLQVEDGFDALTNFEVNLGDQTWQVYQISAHLKQGIHLLDVNYLNDEVINNVDRNAILDWIKIERIK